jgi:hypothetical protein
MEKTNTMKSPLLRPVIEREYTKGILLNEDGRAIHEKPEPGGGPGPGPAAPDIKGAGSSNAPPPPPPPPNQSFNIPDDTKGFVFDDIPEANEIGEGDHAQPLTIDSGSAKAFANTAGNMIQLYLPKYGYMYAKVDIDNVIINVSKGNLTENWVPVFEGINGRTEEALKITDEEIKMWKLAFKDWLEYQKVSFANPNTAFIGATIALLAGWGWRLRQCHNDNEKAVQEAIKHCSPYMFVKKNEAGAQETDKQTKNDSTAA